MANLTVLDFVILVIFFGSLLTGLSRGFIREVVSLLTLIAAFVMATMFSHQLAVMFTSSAAVQTTIQNSSQTLSNTSQPSMLALSISFVCLFVGTLLVGSIINLFLSGASGVSFTNRVLGGLFGLVRGYLINLVLLFILSLTSFTDQSWWANSKLRPSFDPAIQWLSQIVQPGLQTFKEKMGNTLQNVNTQIEQGVGNIYPGN